MFLIPYVEIFYHFLWQIEKCSLQINLVIQCYEILIIFRIKIILIYMQHTCIIR